MPNNKLKVKRSILDHKFCFPHTERGFTLIELLVSIAIIAVLATIGAVVYNTSQKTARISKRLQDIKAIQTAVETYKASNGFYPKVATADQCLSDSNGLVSATPAFNPTYMQTMPKDPNGGANCYKYQSDANGAEYKIWTNNTEMTSNEYIAQPQYLDPARDGEASANCTLVTTGAGTGTYAWAIYSSLGTAGTNACAY